MQSVVVPYMDKLKTKVVKSCNVRFLLKNLSSDILLVEEKDRRSIWKCFRKNQTFTADMLNQCLSDMLRYCLMHRLDSHQIHTNRLKGLALIRKISKHTNYSDLAVSQIVALLWSCLSVVHHFHLRVRPRKGFRSWYRKRQYHNAVITYERVLVLLLPQLFTTVVKSLITFFNEARMWEMETYVTKCIKKILFICKDSDGVINHLLDIVEICANPEDVGNVLKIIQNLFDFVSWKHMDDYILQRFLELYRRATMNEEYEGVRWSIESCLRYGFSKMHRCDLVKAITTMLAWVVAVAPLRPLEFAKMIEYAAGAHNSGYYEKYLNLETIYSVLDLASSPDKYYSLLGCRLMFLILDRRKNEEELWKPKIFLQTGDWNIKLSIFDERDRSFTQSINDTLQVCLITALMNTGMHVRSLEMIFGVMAALVVEVPCAFTAAAGCSFAMAAQEYARSMPDDLHDTGYRIHASVMCLLSLICHVHHADLFYRYLSSVCEFRAKLAPQLNPPTSLKYHKHPQRMGRRELYFDDWEVRYCLYRCFLLSEDIDSKDRKEREYSRKSIISKPLPDKSTLHTILKHFNRKTHKSTEPIATAEA